MGERILVVEDELRVAQALCRVLALPEGGGHTVEHCETGEAALERLQKDHFDLIITDLRMAGMSGLDLLEHAHRISPAMRAVLITAYGTPQIEDRAKKLAAAYVTKPFSMQSFVRTVRQILATMPAAPRRLIAFSEDGLRSVRKKMEELRADLGATGALLSDQAGQSLIECGRHGDFDLHTFLVQLGNAMTASNQVIHALQDEASFNLHFHEGKNYEMYTTRVSDQTFLTLIFDRQGSAQGRVGMVWSTLRRAVTEIRATLKHALVMPDQSAGDATPAPAPNAPAAPIRANEEAPTSSEESESASVLTYEQARALGLINLDEIEES